MYATYSWFRSAEKGIIHQRKGERDRKCSFFNFFWRICKLGKMMMKWSDRKKYKYTEVVNVIYISYSGQIEHNQYFNFYVTDTVIIYDILYLGRCLLIQKAQWREAGIYKDPLFEFFPLGHNILKQMVKSQFIKLQVELS